MHRNRAALRVAPLLLFLLLGLLTAPTKAADWQTAANGDNFTVWIDVASLSRQGGIVKAWIKIVNDAPRPIFKGSDITHSSARQREYFKCASQETVLKSSVAFTGINLDGEQVASFTTEDSDLVWEEAAPETIAEAKLRFVCSKAPKQ